MNFLRSHLRYVYALLNRENPDLSTYKTPSVLGKVLHAHLKSHGYDNFTLVLDDSVMPKWRAQVKALWSIDVELARSFPERSLREQLSDLNADLEAFFESVQQKYDRVGGELVSKVFDYEDQDHWMGCFGQIESDLAWDWDHQHGAWVDEDPHLHVHMSMTDELPLRTIQNVIILYGLFETEIERWHPASQRESDFCWSLRNGTDLVPYTPHSFTQKIYATQSSEELKKLVIDRTHVAYVSSGIDPAQFANYVHVNISLPRRGKSGTLEFRQHRGT